MAFILPNQIQFGMDSLSQVNESPFQPFMNRMNNDLTMWLQRETQNRQLLKDYEATLSYLQNNFNANELLIKHSEDVLSKAKPINDKVIIRVKKDTWVEMNQQEATKTVESLKKLYMEKIQICEKQMAKIMASIREVQFLIQQYQDLPSH